MINIFRTEKQKDKGEKKKCAVFFSLVSLSVLCINMEKQRIQYRYEQQRYQCAECQPAHNGSCQRAEHGIGQ